MSVHAEPGRLIVRGAVASALGFAVRFGARFLFLLVAGRLYGGAAFGAYSLALATVEAAVVMAGLSTRWILFKWLDRETDTRPSLHTILDAVLLVGFAASAIAAALAAAILLAPEPVLGSRTGPAVAMAVAIPLQAVIELLLAATRWTRAMRYELVAKNLVQPYVGIIVAIAAYAAGWRSEGLFLAYLGGSLASLAYTLWALRRCFGLREARRYRPHSASLGDKLKEALPTTGVDVIDALYTRLDLYLVGLLLGQHAAGVYAMARQLSLPVRQIRQAFDAMLVPAVARTVSEAGAAEAAKPVAAAARLILVVQFAAMLFLTAVGRPLLSLVGAGFEEGFVPLLLLAAGELLQGAFGASELVLIYLRPRRAALLTTGFAAFSALTAWLLVRSFGLTGVAFAALLGYAARAAARRASLGRDFSSRISPHYWSGPALAAAAGFVILLLILRWHPGSVGLGDGLFAAAAGLGVYGLLLLVWVRISRPSLIPEGF
ncbi:MAG TPA: oligosaccharide flippase family protein [Allosphingosinicella sp.]|jgi:O-antigen/teichoic acid export membrane protein